jgi:hypothetical protein
LPFFIIYVLPILMFHYNLCFTIICALPKLMLCCYLGLAVINVLPLSMFVYNLHFANIDVSLKFVLYHFCALPKLMLCRYLGLAVINVLPL